MGLEDSEELHRYTRGRFVANEITEMKLRYAHFDLNHLASIAAHAVGSTTCVKVEKLAEGEFNKALLLKMDDGKEAVARVPNPNAGQQYFTTASEVATMNYARDILQHPVPRVYAYNCDAKRSPVGAEFIIMEKAPGVPLDSMWKKRGVPERGAVTRAIAALEKDWSSVAFNGYGSLYHAQDLPASAGQTSQPIPSLKSSMEGRKFVLGPTTGREGASDGRLGIQFDRGPWKTKEEYFTAIGRRELACIDECLKVPPSFLTLRGPNVYEPSRQKKSKAVRWYLSLLSSLLQLDLALTQPCLWHPDLHVENIFVSPSKPTEITNIIDWQSTEVAPRFLQVRQPYFLDYEGPQHMSIEKPELPEGFEQLSGTGKIAARALRAKQALSAAYRRWHYLKNAEIWRCLEFQETSHHDLILVAKNLFVDGEAQYMAHVIEIAQKEPDLLGPAGQKILSSLQPEDLQEIEEDNENAQKGMSLMQEMLDAMGDIAPRRGFVLPQNYEQVKCALAQLKEQIVGEYAQTEEERAGWEGAWPFDD